MLIGQATLRSAAFCPRLTMLVEELRAAGYTVWLEGMSMRFDLPDAVQGAASAPDALGELMRRYDDVAMWVPEPKAEVEAAVVEPSGQLPTARQWNPFASKSSAAKPFSKRRQGVTQS